MTQVVHSFADLAAQLKAAGFVIVPQGEATTPRRKRSNRTTKTASRSKADMLAAKDQSILTTFHRRGIQDVVLMNRADRSQPFNVRPFGRQADGDQPATGWIAQGRIVKKGEKSVRGLFHVSQTEELPKAAE